MRSRPGYLVSYQYLEVDRVNHRNRSMRYVSIPKVWELAECPSGIQVDLPQVVTYLGSRLIGDPLPGVWLVVLTEWVGKYD